MISSKDLEKLWFLYQTEGVPKVISINNFCLQRGVPYDEFDKWFRKTHRTVVPVEVTGIPNVDNQQDGSGENLALSTESKLPSSSKGGILVTIKKREGLLVSKGGFDYEGLRLLVERLEGLC